jgi:hypothetical protein
MATFRSGEAHSTTGKTRHWPWPAYVCVVVVALIVALLFIMPGRGSPGGNENDMPVKNVQGEQAGVGNPQAAEPGGLAPARQQENPLSR